MGFQLPNLPSFQTNIPQPPDALQQYGKMLQLKSLLGQQALQPGQLEEQKNQIQAQQLENQRKQIDIDSQKSLMKMVSNGEMNKFLSADHETGFDATGAYQHLATGGVTPTMASDWASGIQKLAQNQAETAKTLGQAGEAQQNIRAKTLDTVSNKLSGAKTPEQFTEFQQSLLNPKDYPGLTQDEMGHLFSADFAHKDALIGQIGIEKRIAEIAKEKAEQASAEQEVIDPKTGMSPKQAAEAKKEIAVATNPQVQANKIALTGAEAEARQRAAQGDPADAGKLLASSDLTLADLKARGTTPKFITQAVHAAQQVDPKYNPADEVIAESIAKSQSANQFFTSANSLIGKGGTLDQLEELGKKLPQHDLPVLNKVEDWQKLQTGKGPLAGYAATALGAADDYGKVMGGGSASDSARDAALHLFAQAASPEQRAAAINATRNAVLSQRDSKIGNNKFLKRMYGVETGGTQSAAPKFSVGDSVMYQGKPHKVSSVDPHTGKLTLAP